MTDHHDPTTGDAATGDAATGNDSLSDALAAMPTPAHASGFWADLDARLDEVDGAADPGPAATPLTPLTPRGPSSDGSHLMELRMPTSTPDRPTRPARTRVLLAAAALVLVALVGVGIVLTRTDDDTQGVATTPDDGTSQVDDAPNPDDPNPDDPNPDDPDPEDPASDEAAGDDPATDEAAGDDPGTTSLQLGSRVRSSPGTPVAFDPTGRFLYVTDVDPAGGSGCEGVERRALFVEPVDGGQRRLAVPDGDPSATGGIDIVFGPDGHVVVVATCEGFTSSILAGTVTDDGLVTGTSILSVPSSAGDGGEDNVVDIAWLDADTLVATTWGFDDAGEVRRLVRIPATPGEPTDLGVDDVVNVAVLGDGRLVTRHLDGSVRIDGDDVGIVPEAFGMTAEPGGTRLAVFGGTGLWLYDGTDARSDGSGTEAAGTVVAESLVTDASFTGAGDLLFRVITAEDSSEVRTLADGASDAVALLRADQPQALRLALATVDADRLAISVFEDAADGSFLERLEVYALTR